MAKGQDYVAARKRARSGEHGEGYRFGNIPNRRQSHFKRKLKHTAYSVRFTVTLLLASARATKRRFSSA